MHIVLMVYLRFRRNLLLKFPMGRKRLILKYKAYSYWPGIFLSSELKLKDIELNEEISINNPGEILEIKKDYILVACEKGSLKIKTLQAPSKKAISSVDFVRGQRLEVGNIII